ncbi:methionyl-tRNA formyltransferase [Terrimesophilobacter mesophilus]|uniref:Methionyl-tRNA formyltransferase n=1 Tax=Terrimesophilobacter mesophilus TaxID=433647 RepID=A0A4R8VCF5_9MICO|nr:methionyl-tRNA formyltransferase [Terrimesophilobacter mesophilus]TFB80679.1 methionyl-tRNA formyltransferase [Terrimesophilobacter mesophilus]
MRIVFAGSPEAAVPSLRALAVGGHHIVGVITRAPSAIGRKRVLTPTPVALAAAELGLPLVETNTLSGQVTKDILALEPDLGVIVAYGGLVREPLLSAPEHGWINLHFSVLPRWRGAAPVQRAIMAGDEITGASVFRLVEELDAGPVFGSFTQAIGRNETAGHLLDSLADGGAGLLVKVVDMIGEGSARAHDQVGDVTLAPKLTLEDGRIDWARPAAAIDCGIRGVSPEPGAFTVVADERLKVLDARIAHECAPLPPGRMELAGAQVFVGTASAPIELLEVQPAGRNRMAAPDWWRGRRAGEVTAG